MASYFLIAGEASGDRHSAALINQLRERDKEARFAGLGGDRMAAAGCYLYQDYRKMAFMGFAAVIQNMGQIIRNFRIARRALLKEKPDALILTDYPSFNLKMASFCRKHLPDTRIFYYIPPKVWAWKKRRIHRIARLCDEVLGIFPFETDYYARYGYRCTYVGNPTAEAIESEQWNKEQSQMTRYIALLPGSRPSEITHCLPRMLEAARRYPEYRITVAAAPGIEDGVYASFMREGEQLTRDTCGALRKASAAVVNSGTATLETALIGCPQVTVYHLALSKWIGLVRWAQPLFFSIPYFTLVNILAGKEVIRECIADTFTADNVAAELDRLLHDEPYTKNMLAQYKHVRQILSLPHLSAAEIIVTGLRRA